MGDSGVFNIINTRTGRTYTASSYTDMDRLMDKYRHDLRNSNHHNHGLRNDARKGDNFRFKVVARNCSSRREVLQIREAEIYKNRNNTYNEDVPIHFDGGNPFGSQYGSKGNENSTPGQDFHRKKSSKYPKTPVKIHMKVCSKCGHENSINRTYCERCGTNFPKEKMNIRKKVLRFLNKRQNFEGSYEYKPIVNSDLTIKELGELLCKILDFNEFRFFNNSTLQFDHKFSINVGRLEKLLTTLNSSISDSQVENELNKIIKTDNFEKRLGDIIFEYCKYYNIDYWDLVNKDTILIFNKYTFIGISFLNVDEITTILNKNYDKVHRKIKFQSKNEKVLYNNRKLINREDLPIKFKKAKVTQKKKKEEDPEKIKRELERENKINEKILLSYVNKFSINNEYKEEIKKEIQEKKIKSKTEISQRIRKILQEEEKNNKEKERKDFELNKQELLAYVDEFPINKEYKEELKKKIVQNKIRTKYVISKRVEKIMKYEEETLKENEIFVCPKCGFKSDYFKYCPQCSTKMKKEKLM